MDLYIYNALGLLGVVDYASSVRWRRRYFEPGEFEIHVDASAEMLSLLATGNLICRDGREEVGIIEAHEIKDGDLSVTGRFLSSVLDRAIVSRTYTFTGTCEAAMLALVAEGTRVCANLSADAAQGYTEPVNTQVTYKNLLTVEKKLSRASNLGFRVVRTNAGDWKFQVYKGVDRTMSQSDRPFVVFSDEFANLSNPKYIDDCTDFKNFAYVGGEGDGADRIVVTVDQTEGGERREIFVDAKDLQQGDLSLDTYKDMLRQRGKERLVECSRKSSFEGDGESVGNFAYLTDWDLGDLVTVQYKEYGLTSDLRVTEVEEVFEDGVETITPTFGSPLSETLDLGDDY